MRVLVAVVCLLAGPAWGAGVTYNLDCTNQTINCNNANWTVGTLTATTRANLPLPYGQFSTSETQTVVSASMAYAVEFTQEDAKFGLTHDTASQIKIATPGTYLIAVSAIAGLTSGTNQTLDIWLRVDGGNVAKSNTRIAIQNANNWKVVSVSFVYTFTAGQYFEIVYHGSNNKVELTQTAADAGPPAIPESPAVIVAVTQVSAQ